MQYKNNLQIGKHTKYNTKQCNIFIGFLIYKEFPNARTAPKAHMSQGGGMLSTSVEDGVGDKDEMPPI